ncbi:MAG: hypothetical protein Q4A56_06810 [Porphyromonadaceae bacterium]|nr:hypothetical protein [Porphyromonadaceae bacterium]
MKKIVIGLGIVVIFVLLQNCMNYDVVYRSFITTYLVWSDNDIDLRNTKAGNIAITRNYNANSMYVSYDSKGKEKELYDKFCKEHNDMTYNNKRNKKVHGPGIATVSATDFTSIDIKSNNDFDAEHPAGSSLGDIVRFVSFSPKRFIDSGYKDRSDWVSSKPQIFDREPEIKNNLNVRGKDLSAFFVINKLLTEIGSDEMQMLPKSRHGYLIFDKSPTAQKEHLLTVTIYIRGGKVITKTITKVFE